MVNILRQNVGAGGKDGRANEDELPVGEVLIDEAAVSSFDVDQPQKNGHHVGATNKLGEYENHHHRADNVQTSAGGRFRFGKQCHGVAPRRKGDKVKVVLVFCSGETIVSFEVG